MDADSDEVIIKRKAGPKDTHKYDVHIVERLINQGLFRNVCYMMAVSVQKKIVDECLKRMNILGTVLTRLLLR